MIVGVCLDGFYWSIPAFMFIIVCLNGFEWPMPTFICVCACLMVWFCLCLHLCLLVYGLTVLLIHTYVYAWFCMFYVRVGKKIYLLYFCCLPLRMMYM